uniref:Uncharacterized protein n=1 Tax=Panagrolaimus davidi TaxID=227884 RepID=A0A914PAB3_9BILA
MANRLNVAYYPYIKILFCSQMLQCFATFCYMILIYFSIDEGRNIIPRNFYDPCYASNVMPLNEVDEMKKNIADINVQKQSFFDVLEHKSTYANEYLKEKLANLTTASYNLKKQYEEQKEIRYICYKQNLEERCKGCLSTIFQKISKLIYTYIGITIIHVLIASWCIKKVMKSYEEMKIMFNLAIMTIPMIFIVTLLTLTRDRFEVPSSEFLAFMWNR